MRFWIWWCNAQQIKRTYTLRNKWYQKRKDWYSLRDGKVPDGSKRNGWWEEKKFKKEMNIFYI